MAKGSGQRDWLDVGLRIAAAIGLGPLLLAWLKGQTAPTALLVVVVAGTVGTHVTTTSSMSGLACLSQPSTPPATEIRSESAYMVAASTMRLMHAGAVR